MTESTRESLQEAMSAVVDGEAEELELRRVLNAVERDPELRAKWERMHLIGDVVRGEATQIGRREVTGLDDPAPTEAVDVVVERRVRGRWLTGIAAAAAVMIAVTFVAIQDQQAGDEIPPALAQAPSTTRVAQPPSEEDLRRTRAHLMYHAQHSSVAGRSPAMTFVKVLTVPDGSEEAQ